MRQHEWKKRQAPAQDEPALVALMALSPGPAQWLAGPGAWAAAAPLLLALPQPVGLAGEAGLLKRFRRSLTQAWLEAGIDFAEDDISVASGPQILARLDPIRDSLRQLVGTYQYGGLVRSGFSLAVVGRPNVGKSSLFNRLLRQDRAIVTAIPGTTRDLVAETADFAGIPVRLVDTAGLRETGETIERLGIERSYQAMADADLTLVVLDLSRPRTPEDEALLARAREQGRYLVAANKSDLPALWPAGDAIPVSARSGAGVDPLRQRAIEVLAPAAGLAPDDGLITSSRQFNHLRKSLEAIEKTRLAVAAAVPHEFILVDLYDVLQPLDSLTGTTTADDILNRIFSTFCIGK